MATRPTPPARGKPPLLLIIVLAFLAAVLTFYLMHRTSAPADVPQSPSAPHAKKLIYPESPDPHEQVIDGLSQAAAQHKRLLLDFGGDWCGDCLVLDYYLHQPENAALLEHYVVVHVYIGEAIDQNLDIPARYNVPVKKGVPALAVLDPEGKVLFSQTTGEFSHMRVLDPSSVTEFLTRWSA